MTALAWSAAGCSMLWYCRGDAAGRGVVVGAVVQAGAARGRGVDHRRDQGPAVRAEDRLRGLHLDLELQRTGRQAHVPVRVRSQTTTIASTWSTEVTFGRVTTKPSGRPPAAASSPTNRSSVRSPRRRVGRSKFLNRIPKNGGARAGVDGLAAGCGRRRRRRRPPRRPGAGRSRPRSRSAGPRWVRGRVWR